MSDELFPASLTMQAATDVLMAVVVEQSESKRLSLRERRALNKLERNGPLARVATRRAYERYAAEGGEEGTGMGWFEWLVANWETILAMIMDIIGLFGGLGGAAQIDRPTPAHGFSFPEVDLDLVAQIAAAVEAARKAGAVLIELMKKAKESLPDWQAQQLKK